MAHPKQQIVDGCRRLAEQQRPGQTFTPSEIGRACGVHKRAIVFIERQALHNFAKRLHTRCPTVFSEILGEGFDIPRLFAGLKRGSEPTGAAFVRVARVAAPSRPKLMPLTHVAKQVADERRSRGTSRKFNH